MVSFVSSSVMRLPMYWPDKKDFLVVPLSVVSVRSFVIMVGILVRSPSITSITMVSVSW